MDPAGLAGTVELILTGGTVWTKDEANPLAEAVAIRENAIVTVGSRGEVEVIRGPDTRLVELAGSGIRGSQVHRQPHPFQFGESAPPGSKSPGGDRRGGQGSTEALLPGQGDGRRPHLRYPDPSEPLGSLGLPGQRGRPGSRRGGLRARSGLEGIDGEATGQLDATAASRDGARPPSLNGEQYVG